jgi:hypothetical protein
MSSGDSAAELYRERKRLAELIDKAVTQASAPMLTQALQQMAQARYFGGEATRIEDLIARQMDAKVRELIVEWIDQHEDELWEAVKGRLAEEHIGPMAQTITDEFMEDVAKGRR